MNSPIGTTPAPPQVTKQRYVTPAVTDLGAWQSITLQAFSAPIVIPIGPGSGFTPRNDF